MSNKPLPDEAKLPKTLQNLLPKRYFLMGGVGLVAALAGAGLAWRHYSPGAASDDFQTGLWDLSFSTPDGGVLHMAALRGKPLVINFWATWCPPCREELPLLNQFFQAQSGKGWQMLGLAIDNLDPVRQFLTQTPLSFPVALAGIPGLKLSQSLGNLAGSLPFSVVLTADGEIAFRKMGKITPSEMQAWAML